MRTVPYNGSMRPAEEWRKAGESTLGLACFGALVLVLPLSALTASSIFVAAAAASMVNHTANTIFEAAGRAAPVVAVGVGLFMLCAATPAGNTAQDYAPR